MPEMRSSSASSMSLAAFSSSCICLACVSRSAIDCSRRATSSPRPLTISSRALTRSSILAISARRSPSSRSCSARCWSSSSRAVTRASFSCASARPSASARMRVAWRSASAMRPAPIRARTANPAPTPTISAARPISASSIVTPSVCSPARGRGRCHQERGALFRPQQIRAAPRGRPSDVPPVMANWSNRMKNSCVCRRNGVKAETCSAGIVIDWRSSWQRLLRRRNRRRRAAGRTTDPVHEPRRRP